MIKIVVSCFAITFISLSLAASLYQDKTVNFEKSNPFGPIDLKQASEFEAKIGTELPQEYKLYLSEHNGGIPTPAFFMTEDNGFEIEYMYGFHKNEANSIVSEYFPPLEDKEFPPELIPIGDDGMGNRIFISVSKENYGSIYFRDHEIHPLDGSYTGISKCSDSFNSFISSLIEQDWE